MNRSGENKIIVMIRGMLPCILGTLVLLALAAIVIDDATELHRPSPPREGVVSAGGEAAHVILISIDGLRPDAIVKYRAASLLKLMREGTYARRAETVLPSKTLPAHTSMVTGVDPSIHRVLWNEEPSILEKLVAPEQDDLTVPTIFGIARDSGLTTAAFFSKPKIHHQFEESASFDEAQAFGPRPWSQWSADETAETVAQYLAESDDPPHLLFVHLGDPDYAGHDAGWMTSNYGDAVLEADRAVGEILAAAEQSYYKGSYTVIVTSDHGGRGRSHGGADPAMLKIPWIAWGRQVAAGRPLTVPIKITDTAPTVLSLLHLEVPEDWNSHPVALSSRRMP